MAEFEDDEIDTEIEADEPETEETVDEADEGPDDETEDGDREPDEDDDEVDLVAAPKKEGRYAVLARRAKEAEAKAEAAERRAAEIAQRQEQQLQQQSRAAWEASERGKLEAMLPEERMAYQTQQQIQALRAEMQQVQFQAAEASEKAAFSAEARANPVYSKYESRVEAMKQDFLRQGKVVSRENILRHLIGEDALKRGAKAGAKQRSAGAARKAAAGGRQQSGRSDTATNSRREKSLEERLEGVLI